VAPKLRHHNIAGEIKGSQSSESNEWVYKILAFWQCHKLKPCSCRGMTNTSLLPILLGNWSSAKLSNRFIKRHWLYEEC